MPNDNPNPNPNPDPNASASGGVNPPGSGQGGGSGKNSSEQQIADLRAEAAAYRVEGKKSAEAAEAARKDAEKARKDAEKAVEEAKKVGNDTSERFRKRAIDAEVKAQAVASGLEDADLLPLIRQNFGGEIKMDDEGNITGIDEAIKLAKEKKPSWFKPEGGSGGNNRRSDRGTNEENSNKTPTGSNKTPKPKENVTPKNVKDMDPKEYAAWKRGQVSGLRG